MDTLTAHSLFAIHVVKAWASLDADEKQSFKEVYHKISDSEIYSFRLLVRAAPLAVSRTASAGLGAQRDSRLKNTKNSGRVEHVLIFEVGPSVYGRSESSSLSCTAAQC